MDQPHILVTGDAWQYVPFGRARLKSLRATGLSYASQSYTVDGTTIKVRIVGDQSFIQIDKVGGNIFLVFLHALTPFDTETTAAEQEYWVYTAEAPSMKNIKLLRKYKDVVSREQITTYPNGDPITPGSSDGADHAQFSRTDITQHYFHGGFNSDILTETRKTTGTQASWFYNTTEGHASTDVERTWKLGKKILASGTSSGRRDVDNVVAWRWTEVIAATPDNPVGSSVIHEGWGLPTDAPEPAPGEQSVWIDYVEYAEGVSSTVRPSADKSFKLAWNLLYGGSTPFTYTVTYTRGEPWNPVWPAYLQKRVESPTGGIHEWEISDIDANDKISSARKADEAELATKPINSNIPRNTSSIKRESINFDDEAKYDGEKILACCRDGFYAYVKDTELLTFKRYEGDDFGGTVIPEFNPPYYLWGWHGFGPFPEQRIFFDDFVVRWPLSTGLIAKKTNAVLEVCDRLTGKPINIAVFSEDELEDISVPHTPTGYFSNPLCKRIKPPGLPKHAKLVHVFRDELACM